MDKPAGISNGVYSLESGWIKHPEPKEIPELNREEFDKLFKEWEDRYFKLIGKNNQLNEDNILSKDGYLVMYENGTYKDFESGEEALKHAEEHDYASFIYKIENGKMYLVWSRDENLTEAKSDDIRDFIEDLYDLRKESIAKDGEYGLGNLIFKEFRNKGYLDNLKEMRKVEKGKELSLEKLKPEVDYTTDIIAKYREYAGIDESFVITEENINDWALNRVSCYENYDVNELRELLLKGKGE